LRERFRHAIHAPRIKDEPQGLEKELFAQQMAECRVMDDRSFSLTLDGDWPIIKQNVILMKNLLIVICATTVLLAGDKAYAQGNDSQSGKQSEQKVTVKNIDANEAEKLLMDNKKVVVLDVRTPKEFTAGHIAGATNLNFNDTDFEKRLAALDKKQPYLVHCAAGGRSAKARELMKTLQFKSIYHLEGGLKAWEKAGKPVER